MYTFITSHLHQSSSLRSPQNAVHSPISWEFCAKYYSSNQSVHVTIHLVTVEWFAPPDINPGALGLIPGT